MYCFTCMNETDEGGFCGHCGSSLQTHPAVHHLEPGTVLNAKYLTGNVIGEGGFGITYVGKDLNLDVRVAIKEYYPCGFASRSSTRYGTVSVTTAQGADFFAKGKARFLDEARSIAKFSEEPGIVNVRDYFEENNTAYIVMEYLDGKTLSQYIRKNGRMDVSRCISLMIPVMGSLEKFHATGMIHRDISPDNIMLLKNGTLKLMDFGAARYFVNNELEMSVILKKGYSPEEQYRKKGKQGPWTDVYSLCATIYSCITGVVPENALDRMHRDTLKKPSHLGIPISLEQEAALMRGMAVSPENRCRNITELMRLMAAEPTEDLKTSDADPYRTHIASDESSAYGSIPPARRNKGRYAAAAVAIGVCVCVAIAVAAVVFMETLAPRQEETSETAPLKEAARVESTEEKNREEKVSENESKKAKKLISVPDVVGLQLEDAKNKLKSAGLKVEVIEAESESVEKNYVISQSPVGEKKAQEKGQVTIYVSSSESPDTATSAQIPSQTEAPSKLLYCCASQYVTLRENASRSAAELGKVMSREGVEYISTVGEFIYVAHNGQKGYVLKDYFSEDPNAPLNHGDGSTTAAPSPAELDTVTYYCCASEYVTLRSEASRSGAELARIGSREEVQWVGTAGEFYNVIYKGQSGYVLKEFFSEDPNAALNYGTGSSTAADTGTYYCCASKYVTLRSEASRDSPELAKVYSREAVQYISTAGEFYYVSYQGRNGYVLKDYFSTDPNAGLNYGTN